MGVDVEQYKSVSSFCAGHNVSLVAVSKIKPVSDIKAMYDLGQLDFGENYVQELLEKQEALPKNIHWHFIGHLQSNKVKYIAPFVYLIHGVDSEKLLKEINKQATKCNRIIDCLLQVHIASEETKFGLDAAELDAIIHNLGNYTAVRVKGLMGMASFSDDESVVVSEMQQLKALYDKYANAGGATYNFSILSMGMSGDYKLAIANGSNMVRIGSLLFGARL